MTSLPQSGKLNKGKAVCKTLLLAPPSSTPVLPDTPACPSLLYARAPRLREAEKGESSPLPVL